MEAEGEEDRVEKVKEWLTKEVEFEGHEESDEEGERDFLDDI